MNSKLGQIMAIGVAVRLILLPFFAHPVDILNWYHWVLNFTNGKFTPLFVPPYLLAYVYVPIAFLYTFLQHVTGIKPILIDQIPPLLRPAAVWQVDIVPGVLFNSVAKIPFLISDVAVAYLMFTLMKKATSNETLALEAVALWFLNPLVIWVSSGWGQFDSLPVFFSLFAVYLAINNRFFFSAVTLDIGILLKLYPLVLVLPLAIYAWKRSASAIQQPTPLTRFALGLALFFLPLGLFADRFLMFLQGWLVYPQYPTTVGYGLTFWSISYVVPIGQSAVLVSPAIGVLLVAYIYHRIWSTRLQESLPALSAFAASSVIAVLLSSRFVGENFVVWILPFCAILAAFGLLEKPLFWIMSFVAFAFSITSNLLPFYMLPLAPYIGSELSAIVEAVQPYRIMSGATFHPGLTTGTLFVASIGILFSVCLALVLAETLFPSARHIIRNSWMRIRSFIR